MSINTSKLEHIRVLSGKTTARCPACAEVGTDRSGEHLVILESGKWGCIANAGAAGHEHRRRIAELVGDDDHRDRGAYRPAPRPAPPKPVCKPARPLPELRRPTAEELRQIATVRRWPSAAGLEVLVERGLLFVGGIYDDGTTWPCWVVTDSTRRNAQARRLDGQVFVGIDSKAKTLPGTSARYPIASVGPEHDEIVVVEGPPDLLAAAVVLSLAGRDLSKIGFICVTGAGCALGEIAHQLEGKIVTIAQDADAAGREAAAGWAREAYAGGAREVVGFTYDAGCKDLSDHLERIGPTPAPTGLCPSCWSRRIAATIGGATCGCTTYTWPSWSAEQIGADRAQVADGE
ncbi:MAG: hypothetical protein H2172_15775 [Opitutus sp.]|nr:hypothetical protein [Opitutus sp.]MCS6246754.1 hypothetical protein [Opitutus sp.]MCS6273284.1 hypothetical protein [Opitutus sp.]MCS6276178.1 hypothetical protein [Opitutus sp.]MCS6301272.1 hypothetical protein [Opitutus sp.]